MFSEHERQSAQHELGEKHEYYQTEVLKITRQSHLISDHAYWKEKMHEKNGPLRLNRDNRNLLKLTDNKNIQGSQAVRLSALRT